MGLLILLTGSPATGKSTLRNALERRYDIDGFDYGQALLEHIKRARGEEISYASLRRRSANVVTPNDVKQVDRHFIGLVQKKRRTSNILLDSHAVTHEAYGLRAVPFSSTQVRRLGFDLVICLIASASELKKRIKRAAEGRPQPPKHLSETHQHLQLALAMHYATESGCHLIAIDTTHQTAEQVSAMAFQALERAGVSRRRARGQRRDQESAR